MEEEIAKIEEEEKKLLFKLGKNNFNLNDDNEYENNNDNNIFHNYSQIKNKNEYNDEEYNYGNNEDI